MVSDEYLDKISGLPLDEWQLVQVKFALDLLPEDQIDLFLDERMNYQQMEQIRIALMDGVSPKVVKREMTVTVPWDVMRQIRIRESESRDYHDIAEVVQGLREDLKSYQDKECDYLQEQHRLSNKIKSLEQELKESMDENNRLQTEKQDLQETTMQTERQLQNMNLKQEDLTKQVQNFTDVVQQKNEEIRNKNKELSEIQDECASMKATIEKLEKQAEQLRTQIDKVVRDEQPKRWFRKPFDLTKTLMRIDFDAAQLEQIRLAFDEGCSEQQLKTIARKKLDADKMSQLRQYYFLLNRRMTATDDVAEDQSPNPAPENYIPDSERGMDALPVPEDMYIADADWRMNDETYFADVIGN